MVLSHSSAVIVSFASWYRKCREADEIPFWIVLTIALYIPFEDFILKWLPGSALLRFIPELILYSIGVNLVVQKIINRKVLKATPIDVLLLLFLISVSISIIVNGSGLIQSFLTLRSLLRYVVVFYIIVNCQISLKKLQITLTGIRVAAVIQGLVASFLYFMPNNIQQFFAPRQLTIGEFERVSPAEGGDVKVGAVSGMYTNPAVLSFFLLIGLIIFLGQVQLLNISQLLKIKALGSLLILFFGIYSTKKRAALLLAFLVPPFLLLFRKRIKAFLKFTWLYAVLIAIIFIFVIIFGGPIDTSFSGAESRQEAIDFSSYILQILSPEYYEHSTEASRGWVIQTVISTISKSGSWFGFGPDVAHTREVIYNLLDDGFDRAKILKLVPLEDVYWFAMLAYYGPVGLGLYLCMVWKLFMTGRWLCNFSPHPEYQALGSIFCTLILLTVVSNSIERVLEIRPYSYYFWLLAGLVVYVYNLHHHQSSQRNNR